MIVLKFIYKSEAQKASLLFYRVDSVAFVRRQSLAFLRCYI